MADFSKSTQQGNGSDQVIEETLALLANHDQKVERYIEQLSAAVRDFTPADVSERGVFKLFSGKASTVDLPLHHHPDPELQAVADFFLHDIQHLTGIMLCTWMCALDERFSHEGKMRQDVAEHVCGMVKTLPRSVELLRFPSAFLKELIATNQQQQPQMSTFKLPDLLFAIGNMVTQREILLDFAVTTPETREPERYEIIIDAPEIEMQGLWGSTTSILYNLVKNSYKTFMPRVFSPDDESNPGEQIRKSPLVQRFEKGIMPSNPGKIYVSARAAEEADAVVFHVADCGCGLDLDNLLTATRKLYAEGLLRAKDSESIYRAMQKWSGNDYAVRDLSIGEVFDMAFLPRVSGFSADPRFGPSSGLGLWGLRVLMDRLGGVILPTNRYEGGALFTVVVPRRVNSVPGSPDATRSVMEELAANLLPALAAPMSIFVA